MISTTDASIRLRPSIGATAGASSSTAVEATLRESQRMLATLLANLPGMAYRCRHDACWTMEFVSDGCRDLTGYPAEDLLGNRGISYDEIIHPADRAMVRAEVGSALAAGRRFELTYRIITAAGAERWVLEHGVAIRSSEGAVCFLEGIVTDITERRRAEQALAEKERLLSAILDHSFQFIGLLDTTGRVLRSNQTSLDAVNARREDVEGRFFWDTPWWTHSMAEQQRLREAVARAAQGEFVRFETTHSAADGRMLTIDFSLKPVRDENGRVVLLIPEGRDITELKRAEQAVCLSEEKFHRAFHSSPNCIAISRLADGRLLEANEAFLRKYGLSVDQVQQRTAFELGLWQDVAEREKLFTELRRNGRVCDFKKETQSPDGRRTICLLSIDPIVVDDEPCLLSTSIDITAQTQAEQALRESEEKFAKAFRATPDSIFLTELETGLVVDMNEACERMYGYSRHELIGRTTLEVGVWAIPADRKRFIDGVRAGQGSLRGFEMDALHRTGRVVNVSVSSEMIEFGGVPHLVSIGHDITAKKLACQALRESEEKFAKAFRCIPYSVTISEMATGRYLEVNVGFERLSGYSRAEVIGRTSLELGLWQEPADREKLLRQLHQDGVLRGMEVKFMPRDGKVRITLCSCELIEVGGQPCVLTAIEDITEQRTAEDAHAELEQQLRQTQKLEALGQLAGGIAHDFNNILTGVIGYAELAVLDAEQPAEVRSHLAEVRRALDRAKELVRQILAFSRQQIQERRPMRLHPVVQEAVKLLRSSLPATLEIETRVNPMAPVVMADATQIHQIVMNLGTNAAHAMRARPGRLTIALEWVQLNETTSRATPGLRPGRFARLTVTDTGQGMDAETLKRSFEPFFTTKAPGEGTGLGLAVVHGIVEDHDGAVTVQSRVGEGTTFQVFLPEHAALALPAETEPEALPRGAGEHILLVDDERMIADSVRGLLGRLGYRVTAHTDPRAALAAFQAEPGAFDLVISDLTMPRITGVELAREVLAVRPTLPVLLVSGFSGAWTPESLRAVGVRALVAKPLVTAELAAAVCRALEEPRAHL